MAAAATTLSMLALTMLSTQEASAAKECNSNDDAKNNDDNSKTCADQTTATRLKESRSFFHFHFDFKKFNSFPFTYAISIENTCIKRMEMNVER